MCMDEILYVIKPCNPPLSLRSSDARTTCLTALTEMSYIYQQWDISRVQISLLSKWLYKMGYPETFEGYAVHSTKNWSDFKRISYKPKRFEDFDIDIEITHCGVCASDLHTIDAGWGDPALPVVAGHEIVGKALKVGPKVKTIKEGDRAGVGAQVWACLDCRIVNCSFPY